MELPVLFLALLGAIGVASFCMVRSVPSIGRLSSSSSGKYESLDALRGLLAACVLIHHAYIARRYFNGEAWVAPASHFYQFLGTGAVAIFFMITGLLFWGKAIDGRIEMIGLMKSRMKRIMPLYLFSFALIFMVCMNRTGSELQVSGAAFIGSTLRWLAGGLLGQPSLNGISMLPINAGVTWTLQFEWVFYLLLPVLAYFAPIRKFLWFALSYGAAIILLNQLGIQRMASALLIALPFAGGMVTAYVVRSRANTRQVNTPLAANFILASLIVAVWFYSPHWETALQLALVPSFALVALGNDFFGVLRWRWVRWLGHISFSVYLLHGIVLLGVLTSLDASWPIAQWSDGLYAAVCVMASAAVVALSSLAYLFIERPFITGRAAALPMAAIARSLRLIAPRTPAR